MHSARSRFRKLEDEPEDENNVWLKEAELTYMTSVIKQVVNNGTLDICSLNAEDSFPEKEELEEVVEFLYELTSAFYYVSVIFR